MENQNIITLFKIEKVLDSLATIKLCVKEVIESGLKEFEYINEIILAYNEIKNSIEGLDNLQKFIIKNKSD